VVFVNGNKSPVYGGVERWMIDTTTGLGARGHRCVLVGRPAARWLRVAADAGLTVRGDICGTWAMRVWRVTAGLRAERPDLVVTKGTKTARWAAWARATGAGGRVALFLGSTHELDGGAWLDRHTWRLVDAGITVAHDAAGWYGTHGFGPREKLHALWKGVDLARFDAAQAGRPAMRATLGLGPDDLAIATVGRLAWQKGLDDLFAAVHLVRPRLPRARFFVIGGGRDTDMVAAAAAELDGAVTLLGQRDDVPALLAAMDMMVQSSRREVMAQTTLEAMAAGRAVVSTRTMGAGEAIEDGTSGVLVPVGDPGALAEQIVRLGADPECRAALGQAARARIAREFTAAAALERAERVFRTITR